MQFIIKVALSALLIAAASEAAKRSSILGAVIASLPLTSILAIAWLYADTRDTAAIAEFSGSIFWAVLVSLPMFPVLAWLLKRGVGFIPAMGLSCVTAAVGYAAYVSSARH
jgi:hypothetical protein